MNRLADEIVPFGLRIACRLASWPTSRSPCSVKATTDGVVREPSALGMTVGWPPSTVAITEFVVPRSIPTALAMMVLLLLQVLGLRGLDAAGAASRRTASSANASSTRTSKRWACMPVIEAKFRRPPLSA